MSQQALPQTCHYSSDDVKIIENQLDIMASSR